MATAPVDDTLVAALIAAEAGSTEAKRKQARAAAWSAFNARAFPVVPPVVTPPPVSPPPVTPPPAGTYPAGWGSFSGLTEYTTPIYPTTAGQLIKNVSIVDQSGNPSVDPSRNGYNGFIIDTFRIRTREGPRAAGAPIMLKNGYIEVQAQAGDHSDGVQCYGGGGVGIFNTKIVAGGGGATCLFAADNSHGGITIAGSYLGAIPGASRPGYLLRVNLDGADSVSVTDTIIERGTAGVDVFVDAAVRIVAWSNVVDQFGQPVARPHA